MNKSWNERWRQTANLNFGPIQTKVSICETRNRSFSAFLALIFTFDWSTSLALVMLSTRLSLVFFSFPTWFASFLFVCLIREFLESFQMIRISRSSEKKNTVEITMMSIWWPECFENEFVDNGKSHSITVTRLIFHLNENRIVEK